MRGWSLILVRYFRGVRQPDFLTPKEAYVGDLQHD
jgi:hypothetical protein